MKKGIFIFLLSLVGLTIKAQTGLRGSIATSLSNHENPIEYKSKYAILIGIDNYSPQKNGFSPLRYAVNDAVALQRVLVNQLGYQSKNIKVLLNTDATRRNITNAIESFTKDNIEENSQLLIFFAGHGMTVGSSTTKRRGYLIPFDGNDGELNASALAMDEIRQQADFLRPKHVLFLIDACYGGLAQARSGNQANSMAFVRNVWNQRSREVITAGNADEEVLESSDWQHSAFTNVLLKALENGEADTNNDNIIATSELYGFIQQRVPYYAQNKGGKQTPQFGTLIPESGTFLFELKPNALLNSNEKTIIPEKNNISEKFNSHLIVNTNVKNPRIHINEMDMGYTSSESAKFSLNPSYYRVTVNKEKFFPLTQDIELKPDSTASMSFTLKKQIFDIQINVVPSDAVVWINDRIIGKGNQNTELEKGRYSFMAQKGGYISENTITDILNDSIVNINLKKISGEIEINSTIKDIQVFNNDSLVGSTPIRFNLDYGNHELAFRKDDYLTKKYALDIKESVKIVHNVHLEIDPLGGLAKKLILEHYNKRIATNFGLAAASFLGYLYFDKQIKENQKNTNFLTKGDDSKSRNILLGGKIACITFMGVEALTGILNLKRVWQIKTKSKEAIEVKINPAENHKQLSLNFKL